jgi:hypothetical protein
LVGRRTFSLEISEVAMLTPATARSGSVVSRVRRVLEALERRGDGAVARKRLAEVREDLGALECRLRHAQGLFPGQNVVGPSPYLERALALASGAFGDDD